MFNFTGAIMKNILLLCIAVVVVSCTNKKQDDSMSKIETISINVSSMVCGTCEKNISKALYLVEGVKAVDIDVKKKTAEIKFVSFQTNLGTIERAVTEAGYDANDKKRNPDAYEKLDACCKIDG